MSENPENLWEIAGSTIKSVSHKLDPRLSFLLRLTFEQVIELKAGERSQLLKLREAILNSKREEHSQDSKLNDKNVQDFGQYLPRYFAPLSTGIYIPSLSIFQKDNFLNNKEPFVAAFILSDISALDLTKLGVIVRSQSGDIFSAFVPISVLPNLVSLRSIKYVELARPVFPDLGAAIPYTQIDSLHASPSPYTGVGTIVGICDDLIDIYHPDFRNSTGTRIRHLWDQNLTAAAGEVSPNIPGFVVSYGVEYSAADINAQFAAFNSFGPPAYGIVRHGGEPEHEHAHGTHVSGIAVGNGAAPSAPAIHGISCSAEASTLVGAAPEGEIVFVALPNLLTTERLADTTVVADAFAYIFARATLAGKPCVVNLSNTDNMGPHDGKLLGEQFLDNLLLTPGRAITVSAGNSNNTLSHAHGTISSGATENLGLEYSAPSPSFHHRNDSVEIWFDGQDRFDLTLTIPTSPSSTISIAAGAPPISVSLPGGIEISIESIIHDPRNGANYISVMARKPPNINLPIGTWTFSITGTSVVNGEFHAWVDRNNRGYSKFAPLLLQEDVMTLGVPATARRVISVGNHDKVVGAPNIDNESGRGPTRDGRVKPEIASVGGNIRAPSSRNMNVANSSTACYISKSGTSMSAPMVAGACALLFQCRGPTMTWANIKQILGDTSSNVGIASSPNNSFGFGYMQLGAACSPAPMNVDVWMRDAVTDTGLQPFTGAVIWQSPDIEVLDMAGNPVLNPTYNPTTRFSNRIRVTVRNRGTQTARNTEVYLYWADPATNIPFPVAWNSTGIFTGPAPGFVNLGNVIVIEELSAGSQTQVEFAWSAPSPGTNISGDDHFCLLARLENESDISNVGIGGWASVAESNNIALRNVHVLSVATTVVPRSDFYVVGSDDMDSMIAQPDFDDGELWLMVPIQALPWRDLKVLEQLKVDRPYFGAYGAQDVLETFKLVLKGDDISVKTDIKGADILDLKNGIASIRLKNGKQPQLHIPYLRLLKGARLPVSIRIVGVRNQDKPKAIHVGQLSGGRRIGGVTIKLDWPRWFGLAL